MLQFFHKHIRDNNCRDFRALRKIDRSTGNALNYSRSMKLCSQPGKRVRSFTIMDYRNGHYAMALGAFNVFYLHKMYSCSHMSSLHQIRFISV